MTQHVLIIGRGGREAALGIKFRDAPSVDRVYVAPGNPGMALLGLTSVPIAENDFEGLIAFAKDHIDLTVVGPEAPLVGGIVDAFEAAGLAILASINNSPNLKPASSLLRRSWRGINCQPRLLSWSEVCVKHRRNCNNGRHRL